MPVDEHVRHASVRRYGLTGPGTVLRPDPELQALVGKAKQVMQAEFAALHVMDGADQVRVAATPGVPLEAGDRSLSLCQRVLSMSPAPEVFVTVDAGHDPVLAGSPWVTGADPAVRYYAAVPLVGSDSQALGTLCVWSARDRSGDAPDGRLLVTVAGAVMAVLDARRRTAELDVLLDAEMVRAIPVDDSPGSAIATVIDRGEVRTLFQPIVHLPDGYVVGFEALSRGPAGTELESPMALIDAARAAGRLGELDWLCRVHAMQAAAVADLHPSLSWFINVEPASLHIPCPDSLRPALDRARGGLRVVLEVVERDLNGNVTHLLHAADQARRDAWGVALDDVGAMDSSLALLPFLMPDVIKLDMSLVQQLPNAKTAAVTAAVRAYAERSGAVILAEGIETEEHEHLAGVFGATYGQGYRYGRPGPLPEHVATPRTVVPLRQTPAPLSGATPFEIVSDLVPPARGTKDLLLHISRHLESQCERLSDPFVLLAGFQDSRFFTGSQRARYLALSEVSSLTVVLASGIAEEERATYRAADLFAGSRMRHEWVVIVLSAGYTAAFVARDCGDPVADGSRRFDFVYTHDPEVVTAAGRSFMQELVPSTAAPESVPEQADDDEEPDAARVPPQRRTGRMRLGWGR